MTPRTQRQKFQKKLRKYLASAQVAPFVQMIWSVDAIQSGRANAARRHFTFPPDAVTTDMSSKFFAHKWTLEELVNEFLATPSKKQASQKQRFLNCTKFNTAALVVNTLKGLQKAEDGLILAKGNVLDELPKIAVKQFDWQRGYFSKENFFRAAYLFGGSATKQHFLREVGISFEKYIAIGFGLYGFYSFNPAIDRTKSIRELNITKDEIQIVLDRWSRSKEDFELLTKDRAKKYKYSQARPSVLRDFPLVAISNDSERKIAPLPELIAWKITDGLYYETVGDNGDVRREIGERFEQYSELLFQSYSEEFDIRREYEYRIPGKNQRTPDILLYRNDALEIIVECKFKRLTFDATYITRSSVQETPGIEELAKGVVQIWKSVSHINNGLLPDETLAAQSIGVILTMDPWLVMSSNRYDTILAMAEQLAQDANIQLTDNDKIPVAFVSIKDLEPLLRKSTADSLIETLTTSANKDYAGWHLNTLHDRIAPNTNIRRDFAFSEQFAETLPWWRNLTEQ